MILIRHTNLKSKIIPFANVSLRKSSQNIFIKNVGLIKEGSRMEGTLDFDSFDLEANF